MNAIIGILVPVITKLAESFFGLLFKTIGSAIDEWMAKKKEADDNRRIDEAFKNPDRGRAARDLNDVFRGK